MQKYTLFQPTLKNFWPFKSTAYDSWIVFPFLSSSLENLVSNLALDDGNKFVHTKRHFGSDPNVLKKGCYPYEYVTNPEILTETCLPPRDRFYSQLNEEGISEEEYDRALDMWRRYNCKTLKDYHDLYLTLDAVSYTHLTLPTILRV